MSHNTHSTVGQIAGRVLYALGESDCKVQMEGGTSQSPVTSHQSLRTGISLTEVLIAMGILTVGLLGVAAIFPVAGFYMQKGEVADHGSAIAQAAFNELITRGMLNPESWLTMVPTNVNQPNATFNVDNKGNPNTLNRGSFTRPFAAALREAQGRNPTWTALDYSRHFGGGFVIDPIGVGAFAAIPGEGNLLSNRIAMPFPSSFVWWFNGWVANDYPWSPWSGQYNSPLRRVTLRDPVTGWQLSDVMADRMFRSSDDLSLELPAGQDKPSQQPIDLADLDLDGRATEPLARQSRGDYSWLATVVPSTPQGLMALGNGPAGNSYEVSVVVFYKRSLPSMLPIDPADADNVAAEERMAAARIVSTGLSGGEILLQRHPRDPASITESPFKNLKTGRWIVLCGPHPSSTDARPLFVARWYKVLSIEKETNGIITDPANQRLITVRGPQWPWQPSTDPNNLSNNLCVGIIPGAVAVHAKTVQIEGDSVWNGGADGLSSSPTKPQWTTR